MKNYIKPSAEVVELSVKEPVSLISEKSKQSFGFGSKTKQITLTKYTTLFSSGTTQG